MDPAAPLTQPLYNTVQRIADEYGVPFINYNLIPDELGITPIDYSEENYHMNIRGAKKHARHLGEYLIFNYHLEDHRGDAAYHAWDMYAAQRRNANLSKLTIRDYYLDALGQGDYKIFFVEHGQPSHEGAYQDVAARLDAIGINLEEHLVTGTGFKWNGTSFNVDASANAARIYTHDAGREVCVGGITSPGILCIACDNETGEIADISALTQADNYAPAHVFTGL